MGERPPVRRETQQRRVILEELRRLSSHPTAPALYELVRQRLPTISLATVYRNLERLAEMGLVRKLDMAGTQSRFDGNLVPHDHIRCIECGRVADVPSAPLQVLPPGEHELGGYEVLGRRLEFIGRCPQCRHRAPPPPSTSTL